MLHERIRDTSLPIHLQFRSLKDFHNIITFCGFNLIVFSLLIIKSPRSSNHLISFISHKLLTVLDKTVNLSLLLSVWTIVLYPCLIRSSFLRVSFSELYSSRSTPMLDKNLCLLYDSTSKS